MMNEKLYMMNVPIKTIIYLGRYSYVAQNIQIQTKCAWIIPFLIKIPIITNLHKCTMLLIFYAL